MIERYPYPALAVRHHLGAGDHLICLPIYRHFAAKYGLLIPVKRRNVETVQFMTRDLCRAILAVDDDAMADRLVETARKRGCLVLRLGMFAEGSFDEKQWDREFYRVAGIPFEARWAKWTVERDLSREFEPPKEPYVFVHQDVKRGFTLDYCRLPKHLHMVEPELGKTENIFDYVRLIENADELHVIDSCFAILADSLTTLKAKRKVVHLYCRPNALPPTYKPGWEILI